MIIISVILSLIGSRYIAATFDEEYQQRAEVITGFVSRELRDRDPGLIADEAQFAAVMQGVVDTVMEISPDVEKLSIYGPVEDEVRVIASSDPSLIGNLADEEDLSPISTRQTVVVDSESHDDGSGAAGSGLDTKQMEVLAPIFDPEMNAVASMGLYMSTEPRSATISSQQTRFFLFTNAILMAIVLVMYFSLNSSIVKPIKSLGSAMKQVGEARNDHRLAEPWLERTDEVGMLAHAFDEMQTSLGEREGEVKLLLDASVAVSSALQVERIMQILCDKVAATRRVTYCRISLLDSSRKHLVIKAAFPIRDVENWRNGVGERFELAKYRHHAEVVASGKAMIARDDDLVRDGKESSEWEWMLTSGTKSALFLPLVAKDEVIGVMTLGEERHWERTPFSEEKVGFYQTLVNQAAVAIENAQLYEKTQWQVEELSAMHNISQAFTSTLDYQEVVSVVAKKVGALFDAQYASVLMPDETEKYLNIVASYKLSAEYVWTINKKRRIPIGVGPVGLAFSERIAMAVTNVNDDERYEMWRNVASIQNYAAIIALPLTAKGQCVGVICIYFAEPRRFTDEEISLLTTIANEAAIAIENSRMYENLQDAFIGTIRSLAETIDAKDTYTGGHSERVSLYSEAIARALGINGDELQTIRYAGYLHDVGKIGIPDAILTKPGKLTGEEFAVIKKHPVLSERILRPVSFPYPVQSIVRHHHERYDGKGYPDGLAAAEIPLGARILFVADAYEAMTSNRPYRKALENQIAMDELLRNRGTQFDPSIVDVFTTIVGDEEDKEGDGLAQKAS